MKQKRYSMDQMIPLLRKADAELGGNRHFDFGCDVGRQVRSVVAHPEFSDGNEDQLHAGLFVNHTVSVATTHEYERLCDQKVRLLAACASS